MSARGTSNGNVRGSSETRRRRRQWLVMAYRADMDASVARDTDGFVFDVQLYNPRLDGCNYRLEAACRCYRCGRLLIADTLTVDRIIPGCQGGTYRRDNIRPACAFCNSSTGGRTRRKAQRKSRRVQLAPTVMVV